MSVTRLLVWVHRWAGIVLCLFFSAWFVSGAIMIYVPFPSLSHEAALARAREVDPSQITISPLAATRGAGSHAIERLRLVDINGEATYLVHPTDAPVIAVSALDGRVIERFDARTAQAVAEHFAGKPIRTIEGPLIDDQWVVANDFDAFRPFYRISMENRDGTVLYVSARTGEVVQRTAHRERAWNYAGAVVHWIYPTIVRRHWALWDQIVWWLSLAGILVAVLGLWLGITRIAGRQRSGHWKLSHYRGWLKWHHVLGLCAGVLVLTWIFSGWLSMDHGRLFSLPDPTASRVAQFRGITVNQAAAQIAVSELSRLGGFREAEINAVAGVPFVVARTSGTQQLYSLREGHLSQTPEVPLPLIQSAVRAAWPEGKIVAIHRPPPDDAYAHLREGDLPASALRVILNDDAQTWIHIDASSGAILGVMDRSRRTYRWLFNGLHSFDFPALAPHRPLWDAVILLALLAGLTFTATAVVIGVKRTRTTLKS
jgi:hypothetical protein